jgi:pimeloyl-ACP methyl ester carboxylesterase
VPAGLKTRRYDVTLRRRRILIALGVVVLLPLAGVLIEWRAEARDTARFPPEGMRVDVGGHHLHAICIGQGEPTVLFEVSGFSNSTSFSAARTAIAARTRVCSYDRVGVGWSDEAPNAISVGELADDLARLQDRAALTRPFIIVASSIGGITAEMFARRYPDRVAGLVFLDAAVSEMIPILSSQVDVRMVKAACMATSTAGRVGLIRLLDPWHLRGSDDEAAQRSAALMYRAQPWKMLCAIVRGIPITQQEFAAAGALRDDVPLVVMSAELSRGLLPPAFATMVNRDEIVPPMRAAHQHLAQKSSRGVWRLVQGSGHLIANDRPQVVVGAVLEMLNDR